MSTDMVDCEPYHSFPIAHFAATGRRTFPNWESGPEARIQQTHPTACIWFHCAEATLLGSNNQVDKWHWKEWPTPIIIWWSARQLLLPLQNTESEYIFGVCCEAAAEMIMISTFVWPEGTADRGADNIISCLYVDLHQHGIINGATTSEQRLKHLILCSWHWQLHWTEQDQGQGYDQVLHMSGRGGEGGTLLFLLKATWRIIATRC